MKKSVLKKIKEAAADLPEMYEIRKKTVASLGKEHPAGSRDSKGHLMKANNLYSTSIDESCKVDHLERMKKAYNSGGDEAVSKYCGDVKRAAAKKKREQPKEEQPAVQRRTLSEMVI